MVRIVISTPSGADRALLQSTVDLVIAESERQVDFLDHGRAGSVVRCGTGAFVTAKAGLSSPAGQWISLPLRHIILPCGGRTLHDRVPPARVVPAGARAAL